MPTSRPTIFSIVMLCLIVLTAPGIHAYSPPAPEYPGLSGVAVDRVYLPAGYTDKDEEAIIGDPGEQATVGDPGEQATVGDPGEKAGIGDPGERARIGDPGENAGIGNPDEAAGIGAPGKNQASEPADRTAPRERGCHENASRFSDGEWFL